jgi:outer membrane protein
MPKILTMLFAVAALAVVAAPTAAQTAQAAPTRLGFIDSRRIIAEAPGAKDAQAAFEKEMTTYKGQLKVIEDSLKAMMADYETKQVTLSPAEKKNRQDAIVQKQTQYQNRAQQLEEQAGKRQGELVAPIMDKINTVITNLRKEGNYAFIFDVASGSVIAADQSLDLNEEVLTRLRSTAVSAPAAGSAPAVKPPAKP